MKDDLSETLPLRRPFRILKETDQVTLLLFEGRTPLIAKLDLRGIGHGSIAENIDEIQKTRDLRDQIALALKNRGSREEIVPRTEFIIHGTPPTYSRFQVILPGARPLSAFPIRQIWALPPQTLRDLRNIFLIYIHYLRLGRDIDIFGNHYNRASFLQKILRSWAALFWSENILIDRSNIPRFIDIGTWGMEKHRGLMGRLWVGRQILRSWFSVLLLSLILAYKSSSLRPG